MEREIRNMMKVWLSALASLCYCYFIVSKIPKGKIRLLFLLPIIALFTFLPLLLSSVHFTGVTAFLLTWLGNSKLLLFAFDQGPLSSSHPKSFLHFLAISCLPIKIKPDPSPKSASINPSATSEKPLNTRSVESASPQPIQNLPMALTLKVLLFALMLRIYDYRPHLHQNLIMILYCGHVFLLLEIVLAVCAAPARALGLEIEPQSNEPYFSTSLQDFWGRRWNLMVPSILRPTVYDPMRRILEPIYGRKWAQVAAMLVSFLVSGLMHELIYFYVMRVAPSWEVTWFFVLHGFCTPLEVVIKKAWTGRIGLNRLFSGALAVGFVMVTAFWLFFPQVLRNRVDIRAIEEYSILVDFVKAKVASLKFN